MWAARQGRGSPAAGQEPDRVAAPEVDRVAAPAGTQVAAPEAVPAGGETASPAAGREADPAADPKLRPAAATDCRVANQSRLDRVGPTSGRVAALQPHAPHASGRRATAPEYNAPHASDRPAACRHEALALPGGRPKGRAAAAACENADDDDAPNGATLAGSAATAFDGPACSGARPTSIQPPGEPVTSPPDRATSRPPTSRADPAGALGGAPWRGHPLRQHGPAWPARFRLRSLDVRPLREDLGE